MYLYYRCEKDEYSNVELHEDLCYLDSSNSDYLIWNFMCNSSSDTESENAIDINLKKLKIKKGIYNIIYFKRQNIKAK